MTELIKWLKDYYDYHQERAISRESMSESDRMFHAARATAFYEAYSKACEYENNCDVTLKEVGEEHRTVEEIALKRIEEVVSALEENKGMRNE